MLTLMLELDPLRELEDWMPCGVLLQELAAASRGEGGLTAAEVRRLRRWAQRWAHLPRALRDLYLQGVDDPAIGHALYCLLDNRPVPGAAAGRVHELWLDIHGVAPSISLTSAPAL